MSAMLEEIAIQMRVEWLAMQSHWMCVSFLYSRNGNSPRFDLAGTLRFIGR
jgi:hypothetical protein